MLTQPSYKALHCLCPEVSLPNKQKQVVFTTHPPPTPSEGTKIPRQGRSVIQSIRPQSLSGRSSRLSASHTHWHLIAQDSLLQPRGNFNLLLIPSDPHSRFIFISCAHSWFCFSLMYFSLATTSWCTTAKISIQVSFHSNKAHTLLPTQFSL